VGDGDTQELAKYFTVQTHQIAQRRIALSELIADMERRVLGLEEMKSRESYDGLRFVLSSLGHGHPAASIGVRLGCEAYSLRPQSQFHFIQSAPQKSPISKTHDASTKSSDEERKLRI
jgi:hypothetical protein